MEKVFINNEVEISNPILFDASCSGIQQLSAMTKEGDLATQVNLITKSDSPELDLPTDFYTYALERVRDNLRSHPLEILRNITLNRKMIKRSVMTIPCNISLTGVGEHLSEHFSPVYDSSSQKEKLIGYAIPAEAVLNGKGPIFSVLRNTVS